MPTNASAPVALFLFAHQDDEFGVYHRILDCRRRGLRVACAYLTDGATTRSSSARRNAESLGVLLRLGVAEADIGFPGESLGIRDGHLPQHLDMAARWLESWLDGWEAQCDIDALHVTAWEGGHHDHDALHAVAVTVARRRNLIPRTWQYALYQAAGLPGPFFRVLAPLPANGPVSSWTIPLHERMAFLRHCLSYRSQVVTWVGLFPFVLLHYLTSGTQALQPVDPDRLAERPHPGRLYYEKRKFFDWDRMVRQLAAWRTHD